MRAQAASPVRRSRSLVGLCFLCISLVGCQARPKQAETDSSNGEPSQGSESADEKLEPSLEKSPTGDASKSGEGEQGSDKSGSEKSKDDESGPEDKKSPDSGAKLGNLPMPSTDRVVHGVFTSATECEFCHSSAPDVLQNASQEAVAPNILWESSMMAFSARDPYWLAQFSHELQEFPRAKELISDKCTRCHAPAANESMRIASKKIDFETITQDISSIGMLGREGVTCTLCHQLSDKNQGAPESFTGNYTVGTEREIWGPHKDPLTNPMRARLNYHVKESGHMMKSALCASCHTVITQPLDSSGKPENKEFPEQVPFLEWKNSAYPELGKSCQSCHMARQGRDGHDFTTVLSLRPPSLETQREVGDHGFLGGNAYMLELLANEREWAGIDVSKSAILETADRTLGLLRTTVSMRLQKGNSARSLKVELTNNAGHRFPTAYPTRRAWLEVISKDGSGKTIFHSGAFDERGAIKNARLPMPHQKVIDDSAQVQIYEGVMANKKNEPTHSLLAASGWWKDNRLLPRGWREDHEDAKWTRPKGVSNDADFIAGSDTTQYNLPNDSKKVTVNLWFQTVPPESIDALSQKPTPASRRFRALTDKHPPLPKLVVSGEFEF